MQPVDLDVQRGEMIAVTGPSGCGKSTLLLTIAGLIDRVDGLVSLDGEDPSDSELDWPTFRRRVVLVQQTPALLDATVRANLERAFAYRTANGSTYSHDDAQRLFDRMRLASAYFSENARTLSVGEQQRLCLIRALLVGPAVLLLDEPTSALDAESADAVEAVLKEEAGWRGLSAIVATHDRAQADRLCDRVIELEASSAGNASGGPGA